MQLVIVESPAKAKTIEKYLGSGFKVLASYGHIRDLPPKDGSVDPDNGFAMLWDNYADKAKQLKAITDEAKKADGLILATDPDREGEAISWHVQEVLAKKKALPKNVQRVTFNAITKAAVLEAMAKPRELDIDLIEAYLARRALDYLVGFTLSPVLWRKLPGAKSAGRVQSVALRLIVERERERIAYVTADYWDIDLTTATQPSFGAKLVAVGGERIATGKDFDAAGMVSAKTIALDEVRALVLADGLEGATFTVRSVEEKPYRSSPKAPSPRATRSSTASTPGPRSRSTARTSTCRTSASRTRAARSGWSSRSPTRFRSQFSRTSHMGYEYAAKLGNRCSMKRWKRRCGAQRSGMK